jgi:beta-lactamase regulating signal transducer with metallopeptidase domain
MKVFMFFVLMTVFLSNTTHSRHLLDPALTTTTTNNSTSLSTSPSSQASSDSTTTGTNPSSSTTQQTPLLFWATIACIPVGCFILFLLLIFVTAKCNKMTCKEAADMIICCRFRKYGKCCCKK